MKNHFFHIACLTVFALPLVASAQGVMISNPVAAPDLATFFASVLRAAVTICLPFIAVAIIWSGFLFVFAGGNQERLSTAKRNFVWVMVGSMLVLGAWMFATILGRTANSLTGQNSGQQAPNVFNNPNGSRSI